MGSNEMNEKCVKLKRKQNHIFENVMFFGLYLFFYSSFFWNIMKLLFRFNWDQWHHCCCCYFCWYSANKILFHNKYPFIFRRSLFYNSSFVPISLSTLQDFHKPMGGTFSECRLYWNSETIDWNLSFSSTIARNE